MSYDKYNEKVKIIADSIKQNEKLITTNRKGHNYRDLKFKKDQTRINTNNLNKILEMDEQIDKEIADGTIPDPAMIDPITGEPMAPGTEEDVLAMDQTMEAPPLDTGISKGQLNKDNKLAEI